MKWIVAASILALASPAIAQEMQTPPPPPAGAPMPPARTPMPPESPTAPAAPMADPAPAAPMEPAAPMAPATATGDDPVGGYQPPAPPAITPGATVRFQQSPSIEQAYPAPAPLKSYPICKKGQYDNCRQRGG